MPGYCHGYGEHIMSAIAWLIPSLIEGSGGHRTILQNAEYLQRCGFKTTLYLENNYSINLNESPSMCVRRLFGYVFDDVRVGWDDVEPSNLVFATIWYSAKIVRDLKFECKKLYFVQDWEASFNPMGDAFLLAENSYQYGLVPISIGNWLKKEIEQRFAVRGFHFDFCADTSIYRPLASITKEVAICFIYQPEKPRRCAKIGIDALSIVKHIMPDVKIYLYGSRQQSRTCFAAENLGLLNLDECNALYNRCSVGFCISSTNPSRIPFEMMSAGLPVVELHRDNTLYDLPEAATLLCDPTPESLAEGLIYLLRNDEKRLAMGSAGVRYMSQKPLSYGLKQFLDAVLWVDSNPIGARPSVSSTQQLYNIPKVIAGAFVNVNILPKDAIRQNRRSFYLLKLKMSLASWLLRLIKRWIRKA